MQIIICKNCGSESRLSRSNAIMAKQCGKCGVDARYYPMIKGPCVEIELAERAYKGYKARYNNGQSFGEIARRGGFGHSEMWDLIRLYHNKILTGHEIGRAIFTGRLLDVLASMCKRARATGILPVNHSNCPDDIAESHVVFQARGHCLADAIDEMARSLRFRWAVHLSDGKLMIWRRPGE